MYLDPAGQHLLPEFAHPAAAASDPCLAEVSGLHREPGSEAPPNHLHHLFIQYLPAVGLLVRHGPELRKRLPPSLGALTT